jgi:Xaa-Pro aminopeptidase
MGRRSAPAVEVQGDGSYVHSNTSAFPHSALVLDRFRQLQRFAFDIALRVESQLQPGMSEYEVRTLMRAAQAHAEVAQVFHEPYAWFGPRTTLGQDWAPGLVDATVVAARGMAPSAAFGPTHEALHDGTPVILDLAPVMRGIAADVSYSCVIGSNPTFDELDAGLALIRNFLLEGVRAGETLLELYRQLDVLLAQRGWLNCHQHYPDRAIGHLVFELGRDPDRCSPIPGMGTAAAEALLAAGLEAVAAGTCNPVWNDSTLCEHPPTLGLWAIEPHIGKDGVGVKFEEVLVVTEDDAYWLDDDPPHVKRWAAAGYPTTQ